MATYHIKGEDKLNIVSWRVYTLELLSFEYFEEKRFKGNKNI